MNRYVLMALLLVTGQLVGTAMCEDYDYDDDFLLSVLIEILTEMAENHPDSGTTDEDQLILMLLKELKIELHADIEAETADGLTYQLVDITDFLIDTFSHIVELKENIPDGGNSTDTLEPSTLSKADDVYSTSDDDANLSATDEKTLTSSSLNSFTVGSISTEEHSITEASDVTEPSLTLQSSEVDPTTESSHFTVEFFSNGSSTDIVFPSSLLPTTFSQSKTTVHMVITSSPGTTLETDMTVSPGATSVVSTSDESITFQSSSTETTGEHMSEIKSFSAETSRTVRTTSTSDLSTFQSSFTQINYQTEYSFDDRSITIEDSFTTNVPSTLTLTTASNESPREFEPSSIKSKTNIESSSTKESTSLKDASPLGVSPTHELITFYTASTTEPNTEIESTSLEENINIEPSSTEPNSENESSSTKESDITEVSITTDVGLTSELSSKIESSSIQSVTIIESSTIEESITIDDSSSVVISTTPEIIIPSAELLTDLTTEIESSSIKESTNIELSATEPNSESKSSPIKESNVTKGPSTIDALLTSEIKSEIEPSSPIQSKTDIEFTTTEGITTSTSELTISSTETEPSSTDGYSTFDDSTTIDVLSKSHLNTSIQYSSIEPSSENESSEHSKDSIITEAFPTTKLLTSFTERATQLTHKMESSSIDESITIDDSSSPDVFSTFQISTNIESISTKTSSEVEFSFTEQNSKTEDPSLTDIINSSTKLSSMGTTNEMFPIMDSSNRQIVSPTAALDIPQKSSTIDNSTDTPTDSHFPSLTPSSTSVFSSSFRMSTIEPSFTTTIQSIMTSSPSIGSTDSSDFVERVPSTSKEYTLSPSISRDFVLSPSVNGDSSTQSIFPSFPSGSGTLSPFETGEPTIVPDSSSSDDLLYVVHNVAAVARHLGLPERSQLAGKELCSVMIETRNIY